MSGQIRQLLREKFAPPAYALFEEVKNQTGYSKRSERYADALALSLWPSRGIGMTGFEIKVSRADWKKELDDPAKAAEFSKYCTGWYVVAPEGIVERLELPATWGLVEVPEKGRKRLVTRVEAPRLTPQPWDQSFVAALLRRQHEQLTGYVQQAVTAQLDGAKQKQKAEHEEALVRASAGEKRYRELYESMLSRLGLNRYDADSPAVELALERLKAQITEVQEEDRLHWRVQNLSNRLQGLLSVSQEFIEQLEPLKTAAATAAQRRHEHHEHHEHQQRSLGRAS